MWPFEKSPVWQVAYAQNIYDGLVAHNNFGDITALKLRIPTALRRAYQNKMLLQREMTVSSLSCKQRNPIRNCRLSWLSVEPSAMVGNYE
jgi:hypothetical protein